MPADHYIHPASAFRRTLAAGLRLADRDGAIVIIGVAPSRPDSGYGYLEAGAALPGGFKVKRFVEKPSVAVARSMVRSGRFLWNAGMFLISTATLEAELASHCPRLLAALDKLVRRVPGWERVYSRLKFDSFDYEVIEKSANVAAVRAGFSWNDVGSWEGLWQTLRDRGGNAISGKVVAMDARNVLARGDGRLMVLLGRRGLDRGRYSRRSAGRASRTHPGGQTRHRRTPAPQAHRIYLRSLQRPKFRSRSVLRRRRARSR